MQTTSPPQIRTYFPWEDYTDGRWYPAVRGKQFDCPPANFAIRCRRWARNHGYQAQAKVNSTTVTFRIYDPRRPEDTPDMPIEPTETQRLTKKILDKAVEIIETHAAGYPEGEFRNGLLRAAAQIRPIQDLPPVAE